MANQAEIEAMYDWVDKFQMLRLGEFPDFSCAFFNGDFSKTLKQAQADKHSMILKGIEFKKGNKVLDIGCGWGPMLNAIRKYGGKAVGLTLSSAQTSYGINRGLDVRLKDWKDGPFGKFDGVVSIGAFEHFCSINEYKKGDQMRIYEDFFRFCHDSLTPGGKLYLQTMVWGKRAPSPEDLDLNAVEGTPEKIIARIIRFYPGSWLPRSLEQIKEAASAYFNFVSNNNGRLDYIETLKRWGASNKNLWKPGSIIPTLKAAASLVPRYLTDPNFRIQIEAVKKADQRNSFLDEIMTHERIFFEVD